MILDTIIQHKRREVDLTREAVPQGRLRELCRKARSPRDFFAALSKPGSRIIAEIKPRSPSRGSFPAAADPIALADAYQAAGACALSVLADRDYFGGGPELVERVANSPRIHIPVLYKEFVVDPYQVDQARSVGADAVLLIARAVSEEELQRLVTHTRRLGMMPLVETFTPDEARLAVRCGADVIGVNNRDLNTFEVDLSVSERIAALLPSNIIKISESGLRCRADVERMERAGFDAMLIGGALLSADLPGSQLRELRGAEVWHEPDVRGFHGDYGGRFAAETLMPALEELDRAFAELKHDKSFRAEYEQLLETFVGRPTPLTPAHNLSRLLGGAKIYLKREDLTHTGAHKINNAIGQALLAKRLGKRRVIAETGAGQHGVATATACRKLGLQAVIYMGEVDAERQHANVQRMRLLGAEVRAVSAGSRTLKDAISETLRDWIANVETTHCLAGSVVGPHPFPAIVRHFQSVIGHECLGQILEAEGRLPDRIVACVGGGSNAAGIFTAFLDHPEVRLTGVQAGGQGLATGRHAAPLLAGRLGVFQGYRSFLMQDEDGQILETHSISAGLDYPGAGPLHAFLRDRNRADYLSVDDREALEAFRALCIEEGIIPALESSHALAAAVELARHMQPEDLLIVNLSGRGDKDLDIALPALEQLGEVS